MRKAAFFCFFLTLAYLLTGQPISKTESEFWKDFRSYQVEAIKIYCLSGFIEKNFWFRDNPFLAAIKEKKFDIADLLAGYKIRQRIEIDDQSSRDIIDDLASSNDIEGLKYLIKIRKNINDSAMLMLIKKTESTELLSISLPYYGSINKLIQIDSSTARDEASIVRYTTVLIEAIKQKKATYVKCIIDAGADVNLAGYDLYCGQLMYAQAIPSIVAPLDAALDITQVDIQKILKDSGGEKAEALLDSGKINLTSLLRNLAERTWPKYIITYKTDMKELPREKSYSLLSLDINTPVFLLVRGESKIAGDSANCWYYVYADGHYGWVINRNIGTRNK